MSNHGPHHTLRPAACAIAYHYCEACAPCRRDIGDDPNLDRLDGEQRRERWWKNPVRAVPSYLTCSRRLNVPISNSTTGSYRRQLRKRSWSLDTP